MQLFLSIVVYNCNWRWNFLKTEIFFIALTWLQPEAAPWTETSTDSLSTRWKSTKEVFITTTVLCNKTYHVIHSLCISNFSDTAGRYSFMVPPSLHNSAQWHVDKVLLTFYLFVNWLLSFFFSPCIFVFVFQITLHSTTQWHREKFMQGARYCSMSLMAHSKDILNEKAQKLRKLPVTSYLWSQV